MKDGQSSRTAEAAAALQIISKMPKTLFFPIHLHLT